MLALCGWVGGDGWAVKMGIGCCLFHFHDPHLSAAFRSSSDPPPARNARVLRPFNTPPCVMSEGLGGVLVQASR